MFKKGELVKKERCELVKVLLEQPDRLTFKVQTIYAVDFPHQKEMVQLDNKNTNFMFCRICQAKKEYSQAFVLARANNSYGSIYCLYHIKYHMFTRKKLLNCSKISYIGILLILI